MDWPLSPIGCNSLAGPVDAKSPSDASFRAIQPETLNVELLNPGIYIKTPAAFKLNKAKILSQLDVGYFEN